MSSSNFSSRTVVGAVYVQNSSPWWVPVGLEKTQGVGANPPIHAPVSFGATREWKNDDEGWQVYYSSRRRRAQRRYTQDWWDVLRVNKEKQKKNS